MKPRQLAAAILLGSLIAVGAKAATWALNLATVVELERKVQLPKGARPLGSYDRYYTVTVVEGRRFIRAEYLYGLRPRPPGVHIVQEKEMPEIMDGGCSVVNVYFDYKSRRQAGAACNGYA